MTDGRTTFPPEVGLHAEKSALEQLASQARETLAQLKTDGVADGWDEAIDAEDWLEGELLAIGTPASGGLPGCPANLREQAEKARIPRRVGDYYG